ncbi:MAG: dephospho-CoA kinase [Phycisphaerae bacterium]|nr:dephospho-CoA kinase [Phycisphaerae bacterium]
MPDSKPILGLAGGIGSGKSTVARLMGELGATVIDADRIAREALERPDVRDRLVEWWGPEILDEQGRADRRKIAAIVFEDVEQRQRLEALVHPIVAEERDGELERAQSDPGVRLIVLDVPLLFEVGLDRTCDRVVFVDVPAETRLARVAATRGWDRSQWQQREKNQWPLDRKRGLADDIITNDSTEAACLDQVRELLHRIL